MKNTGTDNASTAETSVDFEALQKGFSDSLDNLAVLLKARKKKSDDAEQGMLFADDLNKSNDNDADDMSAEDDDEGEGEGDDGDNTSTDSDEGEDMKKSLTDLIREDSKEAATAMDVEPFLKSLGDQFEQRISRLEKSLNKITAIVEAQADLTVKNASLSKALTSENAALKAEIKKIGDTPMSSGSVLSKSIGAKYPSTAGKEMTRDEMLNKTHELVKSGKIQLLDATKIEGRLNKSLPLGEYEKLFTVEGK